MRKRINLHPYTDRVLLMSTHKHVMPDNPTPELLAALSKFQQSTITAFKDKSGYGYKYATELSINKAIQSAKIDGLAHIFTCKGLRASEPGIPGVTEVTLRVFHAVSGGCLASSMLVDDYDLAVGKINKTTKEFVVDPKQQQRGGGISYARRYLLTAMFGLACDENEGETLQAPAETVATSPVQKRPVNTPKQAPDFSKQREAFREKFREPYASDPGIYELWSAELLAKFDKNSASPITCAKPTPENLTCAAHFSFCDDFLNRQNKAMSLNGKA